MDFYEELRMQEKERLVDSLATENQMLQEPKTPTKEQVEKVAKEVCKHTGRLVECKDCANYEDDLICMEYLHRYLETVEHTIAEWEKIRNS